MPCESKHRLLKDVVEAFGRRLGSLDSVCVYRMHKFWLQECQDLPAGYWDYSIEVKAGKAQAVAPWLTLAVGDPLVWPGSSCAGIVLDIALRGTELVVQIRRCALLKTVDVGVYIWTVTEKTEQVSLQRRSWRRPEAWKTVAGAVFTAW